MLVGHLGAGLAAKAVEPRLNLGVLFFAALLLDFLFWVLMLAGVESTTVPPDFAVRHVLTFNIGWSHSLVGAVLLSVAFAGTWAALREFRGRDARVSALVIVALAVFSHWILDWFVHVPDMPLVPGGSSLGLGLWRHQPLALIIELTLTLVAFVAFAWRASMPWRRKTAVGAATALFAALTAMGAYGSAPPPAPHVFALSSLAILVGAVAVAGWADRPRRCASRISQSDMV